MTPVGRGFDSSFGFLGGSEDHFLHTTGGSLFGCKGNSSRAVDLYRSNASGAEWCLDHVGEQHCSGTHGAYLFNAETQVILPTAPLAPALSNEGGSSPLLVPCRLFLGPGFRLGARWNRLVETVKTRKKRGKTGEKWARYGLKRANKEGTGGINW